MIYCIAVPPKAPIKEMKLGKLGIKKAIVTRRNPIRARSPNQRTHAPHFWSLEAKQGPILSTRTKSGKSCREKPIAITKE